ncbi:hypothetical protein C2845_PM08G17630 [Panicum miliaceum]|uniref:Secreted protein n=1 Tax=Panicum miliaceum TaxID=4540 RepID=A0A3L6QZW4_PANMI|nr:hypothetical protein C2845_PM08G17630 [Panicum miliaceum]
MSMYAIACSITFASITRAVATMVAGLSSAMDSCMRPEKKKAVNNSTHAFTTPSSVAVLAGESLKVKTISQIGAVILE